MDLFSIGFPTALTLENLLYCFLGVFLGTFVGVLPGLGALTAVSLLLPLSFYLDPITALIMLAGIYYGAEYGGSTASILLNLPGTASNAVTCLDGYPMARKGRAGPALFITSIASFVGGTLGILVLMLLAPALVTLALSFGAAEYFAAILLGLIAAGTIGRGSPVRSVAMVMLGVAIGLVGIDINTGTQRFTFGQFELYDGIPIVVVAMGLFGMAEVMVSVGAIKFVSDTRHISLRSLIPSREEARRSGWPLIRGFGVGSFFGPLPGAGPTIASFMAYAVEKRVSRQPERFGTGAVEGLAAPESANNAAVQTSFVPTLSLGIPGSATMAIMLGAMMIHGIQPGPQLMGSHPELFWGLVASFWIGNLLLLVLNIPLIGLWVKLLQIPYKYIFPVILCMICIGVYSVNNSIFDVWLVILFGIVGYGMKLVDLEPAPLLIGFILGPMLEEQFRRAMILTGGDYLALLQRPISGTLLALCAVLVLWLIWSAFLRRRPPAAA
jgi:putative tricarboxylic transport membrane protein